MHDRWHQSDVPRGAAYDDRFDRLASAGVDVHGEAALVDSYGPGSVLDAGCGTGRVAIELSRRGHPVVGVDADAAMLESARDKAPDLAWIEGDLSDPGLELGRIFDVVVMAGNVLIFVASGTEGRVIANAARWLVPGGRLVAGYSLRPGGFGPEDDYAVSVHRLTASTASPPDRRDRPDRGRLSTRPASPRSVDTRSRNGELNFAPQDALNVQDNPPSLGLQPMGTEELDPIDHQIIELLSHNARRTMADIGEQVSLSASAVTRRIERLERTGVIAGYTVVVDHRKAGRPIQAFTEVRFAGTADLQEIKETAMQLPEVQAVFTTAGDPDALVWLQVPDVERLGQVIEQLRRRGRVTGTKTLIVLDTWSRHRPLEANGLPAQR